MDRSPMDLRLRKARSPKARSSKSPSPKSRWRKRERIQKEKRIGPHGREDGFVNVFDKLRYREITSKPDRYYSKRYHEQRFKNFRLQEEYDTYDEKVLRERSKVYLIISARNIVFVLLEGGICLAFGRETNKMLCALNVGLDKYIHTLHYHKSSDSIITVSRASDLTIECRSISIRYIQSGKPDAGFPIFASEPLKWPASVYFDDYNDKAVTSSAQDRIYKVFDLKNYEMLYSVPGENIKGIQIKPGIMLLVFAEDNGHLPLKILSIEDGAVLKSFNFRLHRNKELVFIELYNEKLLVKQENRNLQILNVFNSEVTEIRTTELLSPPRITFLHRSQLFLTMKDHVVSVWDLQSGDLVLTAFGDHLLWNFDADIYVTRDDDLIISYCKANPYYQRLFEGKSSSINISNILTGKSIAKIKATEDCNYSKSIRDSRKRSTAEDALEGITALFYDEDRNEIYTANKFGIVHVWSN